MTSKPKEKERRMRDLKMNPQDYDIRLELAEDVKSTNERDELPTIGFKFAEVKGEVVLTKTEAKAIGEWFLRLSKAIL